MAEIAYDAELQGVTCSNTIPVEESRISMGRGGLSGAPLYPYTLKAIQTLRQKFDSEFEVHAVGGVSSASQMLELLGAGANTVQVYSAIIYEGPGLVRRMLRDAVKLSYPPYAEPVPLNR
jgi:dihydroorotate dehydrogenase